jgi:hypothetical protein
VEIEKLIGNLFVKWADFDLVKNASDNNEDCFAKFIKIFEDVNKYFLEGKYKDDEFLVEITMLFREMCSIKALIDFSHKQIRSVEDVHGVLEIHDFLFSYEAALREFLVNNIDSEMSEVDRTALIHKEIMETLPVNNLQNLSISTLIGENLKFENFLRTTCKVCGLPEPIEINDIHEIYDPSKPTICLYNGDHNTISIAFELSKHDVNILLGYFTNISCIFKNGQIYIYKKKFDDIDKNPNENEILPNYFHSGPSLVIPEGCLKSYSEIFEKICSDKSITALFLKVSKIPVAPSICLKTHGAKEFFDFSDWKFTSYLEDALIECGMTTHLPCETYADVASSISYFRELFDDKASIVIKPLDMLQGEDVKIFDSSASLEEIVKYASLLLTKKRRINCELFIESLPLEVNGEPMDWNLRVFVSYDPNNTGEFVVSDMAVRYDQKGSTVNISKTAKPMSIEELLEKLDYLSESEKIKLIDDIKKTAKDAVSILNRYSHMHCEDNFEPQDFAGVDIIVYPKLIMKNKKGKTRIIKNVPHVIEVNGRMSGCIWHNDQVLPEAKKGRAVRDFAKVMVMRATENFDSRACSHNETTDESMGDTFARTSRFCNKK